MKLSSRRPKGMTKARPQAVTLARGRAPSKAKDLLSLFKTILEETAEFYGIDPGAVVHPQFDSVQQGRLSAPSLRVLGTFAQLRNYCYPSPKNALEAAEVAAIRRLLEAA